MRKAITINLKGVDATLFSVIEESLTQLNLYFHKIHGQCYNGCSTMADSTSGIARRVLDEEEHAVFTHFYCHSLNLAANDYIKNSNFRELKAEMG